MANVQLGDILTTARYLINEPSPAGRFSDPEMTNYVNMATIQLMLKVEWPEATYYWVSDGIHGGQWNELELPEMYSINRVYVAGQICVPTSIPILEGRPTGDFSMQGPAYSPTWVQAPFTGYPIASTYGASGDASLPYFQGAPPGFYFRGGALGLVPPPTAGYQVALDVYPAAAPLAQYGDTTLFPQLFKEALAYRTLAYAFFADQTDEGTSRSTMCMKAYEEQAVNVLIPWKKKFERDLPNKPMPTTARTYFSGPLRGPTGYRSRFGA